MAAAGGTIWFMDGQLVLDGTELRKTDMPLTSLGRRLVFGTDANAWLVVRSVLPRDEVLPDGLCVINHEAVAATE